MKKTIVFLANGFGIESKTTTYNIGDITPNIVKFNNDYLSTTLLSSGKEVCFSSSVSADFQTGYRAFSTGGKIITPEKLLDNAIESKTFSNESINESIAFAVNNKSKIHIFFTVGNKISYTSLDHLKEYILAANRAEVKEICVHLILGINSDANIRYAKDTIKVMNRILEPCKNWSITSGIGIKNLDDNASVEAMAKYYRINTTTVAEVWPDPVELLDTRYKSGIREEDMQPFLTTRRLVYEDNDSLFIFNYEQLAIEKYLSMLTYPDQVFSYGFLPKNIRIASMFPIKSNTKLPYAYQYSLPDQYFTQQLTNYDKKITFIGEDKRIPYISDILNGYREKSPVIEFKTLTKTNDIFVETTTSLLNEIETGQNELVFADYNALDGYRKNEIETIVENFKKMDNALATIITKCQEKEYSLIFTSLYGIKEEVQIDHIKYILNFSEKTPFIMMDKVKSRNTAFIAGTTINDLASTIFNHVDIKGFRSFIVPRKKGGKSKTNLIYLILIVLIIAMLLFTFIK